MVSAAPASRAQLGAILLAAGSSSRLGRPKQLIEIAGDPLVVRQAKRLLESEPACVVVVTGAEQELVADRLSDLPVTLVHNPDWARGMGSSLACGIRAMPERVRAALVLLCDQWRVTSADLGRLTDAWADDPSSAVIADYGGDTGPPAILPRSLFERLSRLHGDTGAKRVLRRWNGTVQRLAVPAAVTDVDVPEDVPGKSGA